MNKELVCCVCGESRIAMPPAATQRTRFWCRECCERLEIARHIADARKIRLPATWPLIGAGRPREILVGFLALCKGQKPSDRRERARCSESRGI